MSPRHRIVLPLAAGLAAAGGIAALALLIALPSRWKSDTIPPPGLETALTEFDAGRSEQGLAELARVRRRWTHPLWNRRVEFLAAYWSARLQLLQPALRHLERLGPLEPFLSADQPGFPLAPQAAALEGSLLLRLNRAPEAARILDPLTRRFERLAPGEDALETWALAASAAGQRLTVLTRLDELRGARRLSAPERFQLLSGRIRLEGGDAPGAAAIFKSVFCRFPQGSAAARALELLQALPAPVKGWSRSDLPMLLQRASLLREAGDTRGAADTWAFAREQIPGVRNDPEINIHWGAALAVDGQYDRAAACLPSLPSDPLLARELLLARGRIELARDHPARARELLRPILSSPEIPAKLEANLLLAEAAERSGRYRDAFRHYSAALPIMGASSRADLVAWRTGWLAFKLARHSEAIAVFNRLDRPGAPSGYRAGALYWAARAEEARRHLAEARRLLLLTKERYRNDYYGVRAAARLGMSSPPAQNLRAATLATPRLAPVPSSGQDGQSVPEGLPRPEDYPVPERLSVAAGRELEALHLPVEAARVYGFALRSRPDDRVLNLRLADLALDRGERAAAVPYLRAAYPDLLSASSPSLPRRHREALYPIERWDEIRRAALGRSLDPYLVCSLILQESAFNPLAVSRAGALGLMQLVPETAQALAHQVGAGPIEREKLFDPQVNILLGTAFLSDLLRQYGGRLEVALAAYNAGASRAARWWAGSHGDAERFVEEIPFTETRLYVKRIISNRRMYELLYGSPPGLLVTPKATHAVQ